MNGILKTSYYINKDILINEGGFLISKSSAKAAAPFSKEKVNEAVSILEVARKYSPQINERTKRPKIICPFHEDRHLGSCRIFTDTNTFKCGAHGDTLTLASGYLGIKPAALNELHEKIVDEFSIITDTAAIQLQTDFLLKLCLYSIIQC